MIKNNEPKILVPLSVMEGELGKLNDEILQLKHQLAKKEQVKKVHGKKDDEYLTPPDLVEALGPFDLDPCAATKMPWRTARVMLTVKDDGLATDWSGYGRVFMNPPYSKVLPWAQKLAAHGSGIALVSAKSMETQWGQLLLSSCHAALWLDERLAFFRSDGKQTTGKFLSNVLIAMSQADRKMLEALNKNSDKYGGQLMIPVECHYGEINDLRTFDHDSLDHHSSGHQFDVDQ